MSWLRSSASKFLTGAVLLKLSVLWQEKAVERVSELFERADTDKSGQLSLEELRIMMKEAAMEYPHLQEHSTFLEG